MSVVTTTMNDTSSYFRLHLCTPATCCTTRKVSQLSDNVYKQVVVDGTASDCAGLELSPFDPEVGEVRVEIEHAGPDGLEAWAVDFRLLSAPLIISCDDAEGQYGGKVVLLGGGQTRMRLTCFTKIYL